ncbi:CoA-binding protein [Pontiellaceae bacterium B12227]|nr:CoA-binding protein [Pontiellaceae bacterium B12227]
MSEDKQTVVVLGASPKPERYSNKAIRLLGEHGHRVVPVHPAIVEIEGLAVQSALNAITEPVDTLTLYVGAGISNPLSDQIIELNPRRVIFNPGTENPELYTRLSSAGIPFEEACTLVLLHSGQF